MDLILQLWGGLFYLANKVCFALAEGRNKKSKRQLKLIGWGIYILGVPAWVIILVFKHNWIAAAIESGGLPAMVLGLYNVYTDHLRPHRLLDRLASFSTYAFIILGCSFSLYDFGGITSLSQILEVGVMIGFLLGSYYLAKDRSSGWLFFMLMNTSMGTLMLLQSKPILAVQQGCSLCFVIYGFIVTTRRDKPTVTG